MSAKWREYPTDVLPLWVAEMDVTLAEPIKRVLHDAVRRSDTGYAHGTAYAEALRDFAFRRWGWSGVAVERTRQVTDVMSGSAEALKLVTEPGDAVVVNPPVYPPFFSFIKNADRRVLTAPLNTEGRLDLDQLGAAFATATAGGRRAAAYLLCSPHNPTGTVHTSDELAAVAELARRVGVRVIADEIHAPLVLPGARFVPYLSVPGATSGLSLMSASKGWNLAGLRAALLVAGPDAYDDLQRLPEVLAHSANHLSVLAQTAALRDGGDWLDDLLVALDENRTLLGRLLTKHLPRVGYRPPAGTYMAWLDCRPLHAGPDVDPADLFLDRARVALMSGAPFGAGGGGHVRLNFATSPAILTEAVARLGRALDGYGDQHPAQHGL
jgi:cystathionine beta-lyase